MRKIIHVDMDCFYAAVEMRDRPELRGQPIAVGGSPDGRGVVATANYEARKYGVKSALPSRQALKRCPHLVFLPPDFRKYKKESRHIREIFARFTPLIEPLSLDEAFLDVSDCDEFDGSATRIAQEIRRLIREETGLTASAGIAPNKFVAKVASDWKKPDGQLTVAPERVLEFVSALPVEKIFGVGKVTAAKMKSLGLHTCADLQKLTPYELVRDFGSWGMSLHKLCRGEDERPVNPERDRKSFSVENTFGSDLPDANSARPYVRELFEDLVGRWQRSGLPNDRIKGHFIKLKFFDFQQTTHEKAGKGFPSEEELLRLIEASWSKHDKPVRLIGVGLRLISDREAEELLAQMPLFSEGTNTNGPQVPASRSKQSTLVEDD